MASDFDVRYEEAFVRNLRRYAGKRGQIQRRVERLLADPYANTEVLAAVPGQQDLRGCRSARVDRSFRIIFVICEECRGVPECRFCFCEGMPGRSVIMLTVGPHDRAYEMR